MREEKVVGLLVGRENTFPGPFIETVNRKGESHGVRAEMAVLGGAREVESPRYAVIVDRISHEVPYYRAHLKGAAVLGTVVVNDPFWWEADEKFFECVLARELGVPLLGSLSGRSTARTDAEAPAVAGRLRMASKAAGVHNIGLLPIRKDVDLPRLAEQLVVRD